MNWIDTHGMRPRTRAAKAFVRYRCGMESKYAYPVATTRWTWEGHSFDVMAYSPEDEAS